MYKIAKITPFILAIITIEKLLKIAYNISTR